VEKDFKNNKSKLEHALELAKEGFHVFPIVPDTKVPPKNMRFNELATNDPKKITEWWTNGYSEYNIGIATSKYKESEALLVVDVDTKKGKMGESELLQLELIEGVDFPPTLEQSTPSGGRHLIYSIERAVGQKPLTKSIDIRSKGGYILGEGSTLHGKAYKFNRHSVTKASKTLISRCGREVPNFTEPKKPGITSPGGKERASEYLASAPVAEQGSNGDHTTFVVAAKCKDFGLTEQETFDLMSELWNPRCVPEWGSDELKAKISNAYLYGANPIGINTPEMDFTPVPMAASVVKPKKRKIVLTKLNEIAPKLKQEFLVEKLLSPGAMSVVYGESGSGKSFFVLDLALHIALGVKWHNRKTKQGAVIYVAAEGGHGIKKRIEAFRQYHKIKERTDIPFFLVDHIVNLKTDGAELVSSINEICEKDQIKPRLIVLDTLARVMEGNENEAKDMSSFVQLVDAVKDATKSHVMLIHHTGKDTSKGARGHSSLRAATDTEIFIEANAAKIKKQRDMEFEADIGFRLENFVIGKDDLGNSISSCVVLPSNTPATADFSKLPPRPGSLCEKGMAALLDALEWNPIAAPDYLDLQPEKLVVTVDDYRNALVERFYKDSPRTTVNHAVKGSLEALNAQGYIIQKDNYIWQK
jgi:KaiC/GvpD/RAD55 family RecA-like ATPase